MNNTGIVYLLWHCGNALLKMRWSKAMSFSKSLTFHKIYIKNNNCIVLWYFTGFLCHYVTEWSNLTFKPFLKNQRTFNNNMSNLITLKLLYGAHFNSMPLPLVLPPLQIRLPYIVFFHTL